MSDIPIYVTRRTADGGTGELTMSMWWLAPIMFLAATNAVLWGVVGIYLAVAFLVGVVA